MLEKCHHKIVKYVFTAANNVMECVHFPYGSRVARDKPWSTLCKISHGILSSRAAAVAKFRLLTGHDCLCAHLFRFNLVTSPICVLCDTGQDMTAAHLDECSALNDLNCIVKSYTGASGDGPRNFEPWSSDVDDT
ncbi:uncharacterized protein TNCV_3389851 [Trichonephila clavipes]|nr:uncharacterized protein TNCV_3389851 [Trichonephila clavipes]